VLGTAAAAAGHCCRWPLLQLVLGTAAAMAVIGALASLTEAETAKFNLRFLLKPVFLQHVLDTTASTGCSGANGHRRTGPICA
jgi:hypothetical protein